MYTLVSAVAKTLTDAGRWISADVGDLTFTEIFQTYLRVIVILSNPTLSANVSLDLATIRFTVPDPGVTLNAYLAGLGNTALPTSPTLPVIKKRYARYNDAFRAGYSVLPTGPNQSPDLPLPEADKTWLKLEQDGIDWTLFGESCMVSVNGFWHFTAADPTGAWVRDGMQTRNQGGEATIGIWSLAELGTISYLDLTPEMIYKQNPSDSLSDGVYINVGQDLTGKTLLVVIGGYLSVLDQKTVSMVGENLLKIDWPNFPYFNRFYESRRFIDMTSLGLLQSQNNPSQVAVSDLLSDRAITAYCTLSQSFIVILDNADVFLDKQALRENKVPGWYTSFIDPWYPLVLGHGRVAEYWSQFETDRWNVSVIQGTMDNQTFYTTDPKQQNSIASQLVPDEPKIISEANFLMLGTDITNLPS